MTPKETGPDVQVDVSAPNPLWHSYCSETLAIYGHMDSLCEVQHTSGGTPIIMDNYFEILKSATFWGRHTTTGRGILPRDTAWMIEPQFSTTPGGQTVPVSLPYQYGGMLIDAVPMHEAIRALAEIIMPLCGLDDRSEWPNACNLNYYKSGSGRCG